MMVSIEILTFLAFFGGETDEQFDHVVVVAQDGHVQQRQPVAVVTNKIIIIIIIN